MGRHGPNRVRAKSQHRCAYCGGTIEVGWPTRRYYQRGQHEPYVHDACAIERDKRSVSA